MDEETDSAQPDVSMCASDVPPKDECEGILRNTLNMLHDLTGKTEENMPRSPYVSQTSQPHAHQRHDSNYGQKKSKTCSKPSEYHTEDKELQRAIRKLNRERKKLVEKQQ